MATTPNIDERIMAAIGEAMPMSKSKRLQLDTETRLYADLGLDSLGMVALLFRLQEAFGVEFEEEADVDIGSLRTVGDLLCIAQKLLSPALGEERESDR
jgi:acyl carrier protein